MSETPITDTTLINLVNDRQYLDRWAAEQEAVAKGEDMERAFKTDAIKTGRWSASNPPQANVRHEVREFTADELADAFGNNRR